jgi:hypothetical protein
MRDTVIATLIGYIAIAGMLIIGSLTAHHLFKVDNDSRATEHEQNMNYKETFMFIPDHEHFNATEAGEKSHPDSVFHSAPGWLQYVSSKE